jgi:hypothetical protein
MRGKSVDKNQSLPLSEQNIYYPDNALPPVCIGN